MNSAYSIDFLFDLPQHVETSAAWIYADRTHYYPQETRADALQKARSCLNKGEIPFALVAHNGAEPAGMVCLLKNNAPPNFAQLTPWLASLYVDPRFRGQGLEAALLTRAIAEVKLLGYTALYLWTDDEKDWYRHQGWQLVGTTIFGRRYVVVMRFDNF
jgi:GNAT superfamily N-acetyltransferase